MKVLSIIIPVFNEEATITPLLLKVIKQKLDGWKKEIIIVDDGSQDNSEVKINNLLRSQNSKLSFKTQNIILIKQEHQGRGKALRTGIDNATGDLIIFQDADLEYDPKDWLKLLKEFNNQNIKVIYGTRTIKPRNKGYIHYVIGARMLTNITNFLYRSNLTDLYTGYKLFKACIIKSLDLESDGFELEPEITSKLLKNGIMIKEVPISYNPRTFKEGKKITIRDGIIGFFQILKYKFLIP